MCPAPVGWMKYIQNDFFHTLSYYVYMHLSHCAPFWWSLIKSGGFLYGVGTIFYICVYLTYLILNFMYTGYYLRGSRQEPRNVQSAPNTWNYVQVRGLWVTLGGNLFGMIDLSMAQHNLAPAPSSICHNSEMKAILSTNLYIEYLKRYWFLLYHIQTLLYFWLQLGTVPLYPLCSILRTWCCKNRWE